MPSQTPAYNLKAVLQETGLGADTLRAWERRYGLPAPQRTPGGHRLYSHDDITTLKWLTARQREGLSISRAVDLWRAVTAQGRDPFAIVTPARTAAAQTPIAETIYFPPETGLDGLRARWLAACLNYNESAAEQTLNQAFGLYSLETVCTQLLARGVSEIGTLWYENRASVQQEHFASGLVMRRLSALIASAPTPTRTATIIVGCPAEESHTFTSMLLTLFLRRRGINIIYLGANVPANRFEETLTAIQPHLILLSAQQLFTAATLQQAALMLSARDAKIAYGGRIFHLVPELKSRIPGFYLGDTLESALETVEELLVERAVTPPIAPTSTENFAALKVYLLKRGLIETTINEQLLPTGLNPEYFATAHKFFGNNIIAALQLGDLHYMDGEMDWLRVMLQSNHLQEQVVSDYVKAYATAIRWHMGDDANLLLAWMANVQP
ncbi:MAG: hypothetical protein CO094_06590 [Anaerolineae bacterium CG_4_9_14_3_um_filter_57_17]|nr:MerR family transcriptional regulator [bacterium]NCT21551.1 MerR family transcriptional regulator [bacterium]OIO86807.1 MAG: hypothetical protein AUK01_02110 [Anaerolineae bacterium CG2_30_57_67]PJB66715.1 MAG: hypothetical protein CO094_06590 [Anaerolineae bacterium CG_4_9_14_3_um_filter_57_17]